MQRELFAGVRCPFCASEMQYSESGRYAEWICTNLDCRGHADIPLPWLQVMPKEVFQMIRRVRGGD